MIHNPFRKHYVRAAVCVALSIASPFAAAKEYPSEAFTFVVPFGAGTATDQVARYIAQNLTELTGEPVIVDNRPGANGIIGVQNAKAQPPDGYKVLITSNTTQAANLSLFNKLPYDPRVDFQPVSGVVIGGLVLLVSPKSSIKSVRDLVEFAKANPGKLSYGTSNSSSQVAGALLGHAAGIDIVRVPYQTTPAALVDLMAGHIELAFADSIAARTLIQDGKLRGLGVTTKARMPGMEDIPTLDEEGVKDFELSGWIAAYVHKDTPADKARTLNALFQKILKTPEATEYYARSGWRVMAGSQQELHDFQEKEISRWQQMVKTAEIEPQ